jgi:hypothetical protein
MRILLLVLAILAMPTLALGQRRGPNSRKPNLRLVRTRPSLFITFDHGGKREPLKAGEGGEGIWLRLHNNTRVTIFLPSFSVPKALGQAGMFYDIVLAVNRDYDYDPSLPDPGIQVKEVPAGYTLGHTSGAYLLRPGQSVLFSVPREHLPEGVALKIAFNYEWELEDDLGAVRVGEPEHFVFFYSSSLPR